LYLMATSYNAHLYFRAMMICFTLFGKKGRLQLPKKYFHFIVREYSVLSRTVLSLETTLK